MKGDRVLFNLVDSIHRFSDTARAIQELECKYTGRVSGEFIVPSSTSEKNWVFCKPELFAEFYILRSRYVNTNTFINFQAKFINIHNRKTLTTEYEGAKELFKKTKVVKAAKTATFRELWVNGVI